MQTEISEILDGFDFVRVQKVMDALNWSYSGDGCAPSIAELKKTAADMLNRCAQLFEELQRPSTGMYVSSGGFTARIDVFKNESAEISLTFEVETRHARFEA
jgi:hypothetical protein